MIWWVFAIIGIGCFGVLCYMFGFDRGWDSYEVAVDAGEEERPRLNDGEAGVIGDYWWALMIAVAVAISILFFR